MCVFVRDAVCAGPRRVGYLIGGCGACAEQSNKGARWRRAPRPAPAPRPLKSSGRSSAGTWTRPSAGFGSCTGPGTERCPSQVLVALTPRDTHADSRQGHKHTNIQRNNACSTLQTAAETLGSAVKHSLSPWCSSSVCLNELITTIILLTGQSF